ncbi:MAG: DUF362 domain-containing protein [Elusimicrobiota bacterium]
MDDKLLKDRVVVRKNSDAYRCTLEVLEALRLTGLEDKKILIKPNLGRLFESGTGIVTNIEVITAIIDHFRSNQFNDISIGESPIIGLKMEDIYRKTGVAGLAEEKNVKLLDFDKEKPAIVKVPGGRIIEQLRVYNKIEEYNYLVSVPVMKTHMHTVVTLSLKNMKGFLWRHEKVRLHQLKFDDGCEYTDYKELDVAIADLSMSLKPDLAIIDGTIGLEGLGPSGGEKKKTDTVVGSRNFLYADLVAARLMGLEKDDVPHLKLAMEFNKDRIKTDNIDVDPVDYVKFTDKYELAPKEINIKFPGVEVNDYQSCSACLSTLLVFLKEYASHIRYSNLPGEKLRIRIGKGGEEYDAEDILLGNCTYKHKDKGGIYIKGCPPVSSTFFRILKENDLMEGEFENY